MAVGYQESVLAPRFGRVMSVLVIAICALTEVSLVNYGNVDALLRATPGVALAAFGSYAVFWAPLIRVNPVSIDIVNPLRTVSVGWAAVEDISTRWSLTITTKAAQFTAWSSPAEGPWSSLGRLNRDVLGRPSLQPSEQSRRPGSPVGIPSIVINQWENHRDSGNTVVSVEWHRPTIIVLGVLAVLTVIGIALP